MAKSMNMNIQNNVEQKSHLFNNRRRTKSYNISIFSMEGELGEKVVCRKFRNTTQQVAIEYTIEGRVISCND